MICLLNKAVKELRNYGSFLATEAGDSDGSKWIDNDHDEYVVKVRALADEIEQMLHTIVVRQAMPTAKSTSLMVSDVLARMNMPTALWYSKRAKRVRICGEGYEPENDEELLGVYAPGVSAEMLEEDLRCVMGR